MEVTVLNPSDYKKMPWKNGKGVTTEIALFPAGSSLVKNDFHWRLSFAEVREDGAFSEFPGCLRYLTLLQGKGIRLTFPDRVLSVNQEAAVHFSGEEPVFGALTDGAIQDFNFIYKKDLIHAEILLLESEKDITLKSEALVFVNRGVVECVQAEGNPLLLTALQTGHFKSSKPLEKLFLRPGPQTKFLVLLFKARCAAAL